MSRITRARSHLLELLVVFVGVGLAFGVENLRETLNERAVGRQYLAGFVNDLERDRAMLRSSMEERKAQVAAAHVVLEFYEGRDMDVDVFFQAFYGVLPAYGIRPSRNTMDEVLNSGSLRLISDAETRTSLLALYAIYEDILALEAHMDRDFDKYLYDETFSTIPVQFEGPWSSATSSEPAAQELLANLTIENGLRIALLNIEMADGAIARLQAAERRLNRVLELIEG